MAITSYGDFLLQAEDIKSEHGKHQICVRCIEAWQSHQLDQTFVQEIPDKLPVQAAKLDARHLSMPEIIEFGQMLADLLFPDDIRQLFIRSLDQITGDMGLRLRLHLSPYLSTLPWEYLYLQQDNGERNTSGFLAFKPSISIVRDTPVKHWVKFDTTPRPRKLLLATADPILQGKPQLDLEREYIALRQALDSVPNLSHEHLPHATIKEFSKYLHEMPDIVHFAGHGDFLRTEQDEARFSMQGVGYVVFENDEHLPEPMDADEFAMKLGDRGIQLVILGACMSAKRDGKNHWSSVVAALMQRGIPAAIAMQYSIWDSSALAFSSGFYEALAKGHTLDWAVVEGRQSILSNYNHCDTPNIEGYWRDWGVPVLYERTGETLSLPMMVESTNNGRARVTVHSTRSRQRLSVEQIGLLKENISEQCNKVGQALEMLADLVNGSFELKVKMADSSQVFDHIEKQIEMLNVLKQLHDLFDRLEPKFSQLIPLSSDTALDWKQIRRVVEDDSPHSSIQHIITEILRISKDATLGEDVFSQVDRAWTDLSISIENPDQDYKMYEETTREFSTIFQLIPASLSYEMAVRLDSLSLGILANELRRQVPSELRTGGITEGINALDKLNEVLGKLVRCHKSMQLLDRELRVTRVTAESASVTERWYKIYKGIEVVHSQCDCEPWEKKFNDEGARVQHVYSRNRSEIADDIHLLDRKFKDCFTKLDKRLLALCGALDVTVRIPLHQLGGATQ